MAELAVDESAVYLQAIASRRRVPDDLASHAAGGVKPCQGFHTAAATASSPFAAALWGRLLCSCAGLDDWRRLSQPSSQRMVMDCRLREKGELEPQVSAMLA